MRLQEGRPRCLWQLHMTFRRRLHDSIARVLRASSMFLKSCKLTVTSFAFSCKLANHMLSLVTVPVEILPTFDWQ
eukprot:1069928-Amphidinium_carterae.1